MKQANSNSDTVIFVAENNVSGGVNSKNDSKATTHPHMDRTPSLINVSLTRTN